MIMTFEKINIESFKKLNNFVMDLAGKSVDVYGRNGSGKTSVIDAITWLFTGADSSYQSKFTPQEIGGDGYIKNNKNVSVELDLKIDDMNLKLKRELKQKWVKKRGQKDKVFSGHSTSFFWDKLPVSKKEFEKRLADIIKPETFKCLSDTNYFCGILKPEKRRLVLLKFIDPDGTGQDIKKPEILKRYSADEAKKVIKSDLKNLNKTLTSTPEKIGELQRLVSYADEFDPEELKTELTKIEKEIDKIKNNIAPEKIEIAKLEQSILMTRTKIQMDQTDKMAGFDRSILRMKTDHDATKQAQEHIKIGIANTDITINETKAKLSDLVDKWQKIKEKTFKPDLICFACGQNLPTEKIADQKGLFNQNVADELAKIDREGREAKAILTTMTDLKNNQVDKKNVTMDILKNIKTELDAVTSEREKFVNTEKVQPPEIEKIEEKINALRQSGHDNINTDLENELVITKKSIEKKLAKVEQTNDIKKRILSLETLLDKTAVEFERNERELIAVEDYEKMVSEKIEEGVNQHFKITKFKLFEHQINGGLRQICEPTFNGVSYNADLNTGKKVHIGLDCISSLSGHYGLKTPVMVDNAESITRWQPYDGQILRFYAEKKTKELKVIKNEEKNGTYKKI